MFTTDTQGDGSEPAISCISQECLDAWPLVTAEGEVTIGPELSGQGRKIEHEGGEWCIALTVVFWL